MCIRDSDEIEAYQRGALFGGQKYTLQTLPSIYKDLEEGPIDITNHPNIKYLLNNSEMLIRVAKRTRTVFRYNKMTYDGKTNK